MLAHTAGENTKWYSHVRKLAVSLKVEHAQPYDLATPLPGFPKETENTRVFRAALLTITEHWKRPKPAPSAGRSSSVLSPYLLWYYIHTAEHRSAVKDADYWCPRQTGWMSKSLCSWKKPVTKPYTVWFNLYCGVRAHDVSSCVGLPVEGRRGHCKRTQGSLGRKSGEMQMVCILTRVHIYQNTPNCLF